jgi:hypothetical protein
VSHLGDFGDFDLGERKLGEKLCAGFEKGVAIFFHYRLKMIERRKGSLKNKGRY